MSPMGDGVLNDPNGIRGGLIPNVPMGHSLAQIPNVCMGSQMGSDPKCLYGVTDGIGSPLVIPMIAVVSELSCCRDERDVEELLLEASQDAGQEPP